MRIDGRMVPLKLPPLDAAQTRWLCYGVMTDQQKHRLEEDLEVDFSFGLQGVARFRANVFNQRGATAGAFRTIPEVIRSFEQLGLPPIVQSLCDKPRGLVLVTGVTGSGKSTTLAAMIDRINETEPLHILTVEDPVEYVHQHKRSLVNQREIHADTQSFKKALRSALRQDPDVVLVGELRDLETIESAPDHRRDRPPDLRHPAHQLLRADHQPHHRRVPRPTSSRRSGPSFPWCWKGCSARRSFPRPRARAVPWPWR